MFNDESVTCGIRFPASSQPAAWAIRHVVKCVNLPVGVIDGRTHLATRVFKNKHVVDIVAGTECTGALCPELDEFCQLPRRKRAESFVVGGCIQHDFTSIIGHRRPPVGYRLDRVRL